MTTRRAATTIGVALALGGMGAGFAQGQDERATSDRSAVGDLAPQLPVLVDAFRRAQRESDHMIPTGGTSEPADLRPGEAPQYSRRLATVGGQDLYAWPARGEVCVSIRSTGGCVSTAILARNGALVGTRFVAESAINAADIHQVFVLARDGVDEVVVSVADGSELVADTRDNGAVLNVAAEPISARWENVDGTQGQQRIAMR